MTKSTPHPPATDLASPYESLDSRKLHDAAERALDHYLNPAAHIMTSTCEPESMYLANPKYNTELCWPTPAKPWVQPAKCSTTSPQHSIPPTARLRWVSHRWSCSVNWR